MSVDMSLMQISLGVKKRKKGWPESSIGMVCIIYTHIVSRFVLIFISCSLSLGMCHVL